MQKVIINVQEGSSARLYRSFSPATRAALWFVIPFTLVDAIHYYTAGTALLISLPVLVVVYLACGSLAARFAVNEAREISSLPRVGSSAGLRLWIASTIINTLLALILGIATLGGSLLSSAAYLCIFAPFHALGSACLGWLGGWLYRSIYLRTRVS